MMAQKATGETLVLDDLPIPVERDEAWRIVRDHGSVVNQDNNGFAVTGMDVVELVLRNPGIFSSRQAFDSLSSPLPLVPIAFDPPEHARYRKILHPFFSPRSIRPLEAELRRQIIELIEPLENRDSFDFVAEVAMKFPVQVFLTLFGLPLEHRDRFLRWKDGVLDLGAGGGTPEPDSPGLAAALEMFGYLAELVAKRRGVPGEDILSELLCLTGDDALTDEEVIGLCFLFVLAGLDTVTDALGFGMERLARNPERRQEIVADPGIIPAAIEELVRLDPPAPFVPRITTEDTVIDGRHIPAGTRVSSFLAAANRDETRYSDPYEIDFHRGDNPHASFGVGIHRCLGSHLARLEMRLVYEEWHRLYPDYDIVPGTTPRVKWPRGTIGLEALHLTFDGAADA